VDPEKKDSEANKLLLEHEKKQEEEEEKKKKEEKELENIEETTLAEDFKFTYRMPNISLKQDDILKLTAQYVAINGEDFLIALTERKRHDPLFNFLKPSNSKFNYFLRMVDSYVKIIGFGAQDYKKLQEAVSEKR
jgi:hypothetical protein